MCAIREFIDILLFRDDFPKRVRTSNGCLNERDLVREITRDPNADKISALLKRAIVPFRLTLLDEGIECLDTIMDAMQRYGFLIARVLYRPTHLCREVIPGWAMCVIFLPELLNCDHDDTPERDHLY